MFKSNFRWLGMLLLAQPVSAEVVLAPLFQNGAVLQREKPVPVWGKADAGKEVTVSFAGQTKKAAVAPNGHWQVALDPLPASAEGRTLTVTETDSTPKEINDILVGEVWLCSGQSNMEWMVGQTTRENQVIAAKRSVPLLRLFSVPKAISNTRLDTINSSWVSSTPDNANRFSAVGYFFGKLIAEELNVPVGIIHSSWGGSRIEPWWAEEGLAQVPEFAATAKERLTKTPGFPEYDGPFKTYVGSLRDWTNAADQALAIGTAVPEMPTGPQLLKAGPGGETGTYQAMIHPLVPYALRGFLWYQGESNATEGMLYPQKQRALLAGWRTQFNAPEAPFLYVQIAPYFYGKDFESRIPEFWTAQQAFLKIPHSGMAVTNDIGNPKDIHPQEKFEVARRLSLWAMADTYGKKDTVYSGPLYNGYKVNGNGILISFDHTGGGLVTRDGKPPTLLEVAGEDGNFKPAEGKISPDGKLLFISSPEVPTPDRARFAWSQTAEPNLMNKEGLPAAAFHTHWPLDPTLGTNLLLGKPFVSSHPNGSGWDTGLTDGIWGSAAPTAYATDPSAGFPKTATIDIGSTLTLGTVIFGTPEAGSTKTVAVSISEDGKTFTEVGRQDFEPKKAGKARIKFAPAQARYVRVTFLGNHAKQDDFDANYAFLSEVEAYAN